MIKKLIKSPDFAFILLPLIGIVSIYLYYFASKLVLGYWPSPYKPDPKTANLLNEIGWLYSTTYFLLFSSLFSVVSYAILLPYRKFYYAEQGILIKVIFFLGAWFGAYVWFTTDPFNVIEWFFD